MSEPFLRRSEDVDYEPVDAADGLRRGVLIAEEHGAPNFAIRRFTLEPDAEVPRHTNAVEHEQYVLEGDSYVVGIKDTEYRVEPGDSMLIPADVEHWYRNDSDEQAAFLCAVPTGDDEIRLAE